MKKTAILLLLASALTFSCTHERYTEKPFGGMKGQVQMVTEIHSVPKELWPKQENYNPIYFTNISVYDPIGNEITSAYKDDQDYILMQAESVFDGHTCVKSVQKSDGEAVSTLVLVSQKGKVLEYDRTMGRKTQRVSVREITRGSKSTSQVTIDGELQSTTVLTLDKDGYPLEVVTNDVSIGTTVRETNSYDENHNIVEKHSFDEFGRELVLFYVYQEFDSKGNWTRAITYDKARKPKEEIVREIKYW